MTVFGPGILPSKSHQLKLPIPIHIRETLFGIIQNEVGEFNELSVHRQRGEERKGFALLLLRNGAPQAFVKVRHADHAEALERENEALEAVAKFQPKSFSATTSIATGDYGGWRFLAMQPLAPLIHRTPKRPPIKEISHEIASALQNIARPTSTPDHWAPMHGDLTPWNLRSVGKRLTLFDWEHVGWGPPGSDQALYQMTSRRLHLRTPPEEIDEESYRFWVTQGRL